mgnify:CR=1 FL=1
MDKSEKNISIIGIAIIAVIALMVVFSIISVSPVEKDNLQRFDSYDSMAASFEEAKEQNYYKGGWGRDLLMTTGMAESADAGNAAPTSQGNDFSETNVQVQGVDEADIMKTDGKYGYFVSGNNVYIVDAYPAENAEVKSIIELEGMRPTEIFINENKLVVFSMGLGATRSKLSESYCFGCNNSIAVVQVYDISDRSNPMLEKETEFEGFYLTSRMIDDKVYFVVNTYPNYHRYFEGNSQDNNNIIPMMRENGVEKRIAEATEIGFIPDVPSTSFVTIAGLDLGNNSIEKETIAASGQAVYASQTNLYLAEQVWDRTILPLPFEVLKSVFVPEWDNIEKTSVINFKLDSGKASFVAEGTVPGRILNQFSMDEYDNHFRIATTVGRNGSNNVYVLGSDMNVVGALEELAPGESIYSARFMGEKAYVVTFKKVDPLFVLDLSDHTNPHVLGKLKIPGYSDYLHPIDETHLIGVGKDSIEAKGDFAWYQGIKMAIFDVSDVANPIEMHKIIIGDRGTDSVALRDHRAFLYDKEKELLVLPITLAEISEDQRAKAESQREEIDSRWNDFPLYGENTFQGAMVFNVNLADGFSERGRITHVSEEDELKTGYYYNHNTQIKRSFYINEALFTFSNSLLKANNLSSLEAISEVTLDETGNSNYYGPEMVIN